LSLALATPRRRVPAAASRPARIARPRPLDGLAAGPLALRLRTFEQYLKSTLGAHARAPGRLGEAIRYAALSPGKRLRPLFVLTACEAVGGPWRRALPAAAAVECVHAFSLVHDDLPAMDDDDYRRGRLTTHKRFGEALGILAGDALIAFAFEELSRLAARGVPPGRVVAATTLLARASGAGELIAGQALDLAAEGRPVTRRGVADIHQRKTGALLGASLALGALAGGANAAAAERLRRLGVRLGLAFQIHDDLLNAGSTLGRLGKRAGTDAARGKATYPRAVGIAAARAEADQLLSSVHAVLARGWPRSAHLQNLVTAVASRDR
jgi:geranylgeranyl diphosphate synthase type II